MSEIRDDLSTIADLVHGHGTERDKRTWARVRAEIDRLRVRNERLEQAWDDSSKINDRLRRERDAAREALRLGAATGPGVASRSTAGTGR